MDIKITLTETDLKELILDKIEKTIDTDIDIKDIKILVKTKQNYKAEWDEGSFKAEYTVFNK